MRLVYGWFTDTRLVSVSASARYLLIASECWSRSNRTLGQVSKQKMIEIMVTCAVTKEHAYELIDSGLMYFEDGAFTIVGLTVDNETQCIDTAEKLLCEADEDPIRSHWRSCLSAQEHKSKPILVGAWRLAVLNKWMNGMSTPKKHENKRNVAHANTIAKIDAMAAYMMENAADAPTEDVLTNNREFMVIE